MPYVVSMVDERMCPRCRQPFYVPSTPRRGRPQQWCSQACRRAGYEERRAAKNGAIAIEYVEKPAPTITLDEHVAAVLDSPAACRNVLRSLRDLALAGELDRARWSGVGHELGRLIDGAPGQRSERGLRRPGPW